LLQQLNEVIGLFYEKLAWWFSYNF
jgi:hypothetical protein